MPRYRKKPVEIEAVLYNGNHDTGFMGVMGAHFVDFPKWLEESQIPYSFDKPSEGKWMVVETGIMIGTLEGHHIGSPGDYIIKGIVGEIYPCKPDIFHNSYQMIVTENELMNILSWDSDPDEDGELPEVIHTHDGDWVADGDNYVFEPNKEN